MKYVSVKKDACNRFDCFTPCDRRPAPDRFGFGPIQYVSILLCTWILFLSSYTVAAVQQPDLKNVDIRVKAQPETAAIGDPVRIDLDITTPQGYQVEIPEPERQTGDFFILEFFPGPVMDNGPVIDNGPLIDDTENPENKTRSSKQPDPSLQRHRARIVATVYKTGKFTFPGVPVYVTDNEGKKTVLQTIPVDVEIRSILAGNDTDLRDLKKQADIPEPSRWYVWALIGIAIIGLAAVAWYFRKKHKSRPLAMPLVPVQDPFEKAESDLRELIARNLPENGHTKKFYVLLSEIVKRILEAAYGIHTAEQTTIEIMDFLHRQSEIKRDSLEEVESLLLQCDIVKFAKYVPLKNENDHAAESSFRILAQAREHISVRNLGE